MKEKFPANKTGRILIFFASLILILTGIILSFQDKTASATVTYGSAILCLVFVFLPAFKKFKGLGIEAELLEQKIEEADHLIKNLKSFSLPTAELLFTNVARTGRWSGPIARRERDRLREDIENSLKNMGISDSEIDKTKHDWHHFNLFDLTEDIYKNLDKIISEKISKAEKRIKEIPQPIKPEDHDKRRERVSQKNLIGQWRREFNLLRQQDDLTNLGDQIKSKIEECPFLSSEEKKTIFMENDEFIEDLVSYGKNKRFRRPDVWFSKDDQ